MNNLTIDKALKGSIVIGILLIAFSFFYYFVIFLPQKEQARIEREKQEQVDKELKEQQAKEEAEQALNTCIANAGEKYTKYWNSECKRLGKLTSSCIAILDMNFDEYLKDKGLTEKEYREQRGITEDTSFAGLLDYSERQDECSCALPSYLSDNASEILADNKDECFKKYPQK